MVRSRDYFAGAGAGVDVSPFFFLLLFFLEVVLVSVVFLSYAVGMA